ncbi:MAG: hypothetical protein ACYDDZ_09940 [Acidimicrobiales bacterium]
MVTLDEPTGRSTGETMSIERAAWTFVWIGVLIGGLDLWGEWTSWDPVSVLAPLLVIVALSGMVLTWTVASPRSLPYCLATVGSIVGSTLALQGVAIHVRRFYTTDSAAFDQVAAGVLRRGADPYAASMAPAAHLLQVPSNFWTYLVDGGYVSHVSYPAGSFLLQMPALLLGFRHEIVDWLDLGAWLVTGVLLFVLLPHTCRWVGPLLLAIPTFANIFSSGGTDAAYLPFLVVAVWQWDRFADRRRSALLRWSGPVALGLACSVKQTPWFCVPFLVVGVFLEARASGLRPFRISGTYLVTVLAVFGAVNAPFVIWHPASWLRGVLLPIVEPLVADGQGLVTLALHGLTRGVWLPLLSVAGGLVVVGLLIAFVVWYPSMKRIWMLALPLAFFVAPRSLSTYFLDLVPAAIVAVLTVAPARQPWPAIGTGRLHRPYGVGVVAAAVAAAALCIAAFLTPPLQVDVRSVRVSNAETAFDSVTVSVANTTGRTVLPHFMVDLGGSHPSGFWNTAGDRQVAIGPHSSVTVTLYPPTRTGSPAHGARWVVQAFTPSPDALSTSSSQTWRYGRLHQSVG